VRRDGRIPRLVLDHLDGGVALGARVRLRPLGRRGEVVRIGTAISRDPAARPDVQDASDFAPQILVNSLVLARLIAAPRMRACARDTVEPARSPGRVLQLRISRDPTPSLRRLRDGQARLVRRLRR
jgi:hypothetical protein